MYLNEMKGKEKDNRCPNKLQVEKQTSLYQ